MSYAIICDARYGSSLEISTLALVDRRRTRKTWWTSDDSSLMMQFRDKDVAEKTRARLARNNARVVDLKVAETIIDSQANRISFHEASQDAELGWDAHKD